MFSGERLAGAIVAGLVIAGSAFLAWALLRVAGNWSQIAGDVVAIYLLYSTLTTKDLWVHGRAVSQALEKTDLAQARQAVSRIVGRDTASLQEPGIVRAAVESVAESTVDGVVAPLFYAVLLGPVGAIAYRAINTLDSMFGYRNQRYEQFGWVSARLDDLANYLPARLSLIFISLGALLSGGRPLSAWRLGRRDASRHASPNAGYSEAAFAGALGVQLGGPLYRDGQYSPAASLGDPSERLVSGHIRRAGVLMFMTSLVGALFMTAILVWWNA